MVERRISPENLKQTTNIVVMVSPDQFGFNLETVGTNAFASQSRSESEDIDKIAAMREFDKMVETLRKNDINVLVLPSREDVVTPDAVFPNNWFSYHQEGILVVYPMLAESRRAERQVDNLVRLLATVDINPNILDLSSREKIDGFLEGTGSLVLDRVHKTAFAIESPRTTSWVFDEWCGNMGYEGVLFHATDREDRPIYHTNVVMSIGEKFTIVCLEAIKDAKERGIVAGSLREHGRLLIPITLEQVSAYCGNVLQLESLKGEPKIVMSKTAHDAFTDEQLYNIEQCGDIVVIDIPTIERVGGGSARCMMAEIICRT